jgi:aspartate-semialdehyde dehydrogenase
MNDLAESAYNPGLNRTSALVAGEWMHSDARFQVINPATEDVISEVADTPYEHVSLAIAEAKKAQLAWWATSPRHRESVLNSWCDEVLTAKDALADLIVLEQGKPKSEALGEVEYAASFLRWFAAETRRSFGKTIPSHFPDAQLMTTQVPVGVAALITPWNFPAAMLTRKAGAALAAGCSVIAHPSPETPLTALVLGELAIKAGLPKGLLSILPGDSPRIVSQLCSDARVGAISFTGSTKIGSLIAAQSAPTVKRLSMELGGHAPFIGFADFELSELVDAAINAKFQTSGQDCLAANRILIEESIYEDFITLFSQRVSELIVGDGFDVRTNIGPLQNAAQVAKNRHQLEDAVAKGARLIVDDAPSKSSGYFCGPAVVADIDESMEIWSEETFGPVAAVRSFSSIEQACDLANDTYYGLAAYIFTRDIGRALQLKNKLEFGMVAVNRVSITGPEIPFGGVKMSGLGREGADQGMLEFMETQYCCLQLT